MGKFTVPAEDRAIGDRVRAIRRRRGLALETAAGLAGIHHSFLSRLERGERPFIRRGLLEDLAVALSCSVADLTGGQEQVTDRRARAANAAIPALNRAFYDTELDDVPDIAARPLATLLLAVTTANVAADQGEYDRAGRELGVLVTELQVIAATGGSEDRRAALAGLAEACIVAGRLARITGNAALSVTAARRGHDAARLLERPDLIGLTMMSQAGGLMRLGAHRRASSVAERALTELASESGPTPENSAVAEARGMLHLHAAMLAAREHDAGAVDTHLMEAHDLAQTVGERNSLQFHFGPTNVAAWRLGIGVEAGNGPEAAQRFAASHADVSLLGSRGRASAVHFDLARAWAQAEGDRDADVVRALDTADRLAPIRVRSDPLARDLVVDLHRRAKRRVWELDSLRNRLGVA